jgi:mono/diheme cytochrome c family protein
MFIRVASVALALSFGGVVLAQEPVSLRPDDPLYRAMGKRIYAEQCAACHGENLQGQKEWRRRKADGRLPAPPHDETGHTWHHPDDVLFDMTKQGPAKLAGAGYQSDMPAYAESLSDAQIIAVLSYIKSRWPAEIQARHSRMNQRR